MSVVPEARTKGAQHRPQQERGGGVAHTCHPGIRASEYPGPSYLPFAALVIALARPEEDAVDRMPIGRNFQTIGGCRVAGKGEDLIWNVTAGFTGNCQLVPGDTYYLNIINASGTSDLTQSTCGSSTCSLGISHTGIGNH